MKKLSLSILFLSVAINAAEQSNEADKVRLAIIREFKAKERAAGTYDPRDSKYQERFLQAVGVKVLNPDETLEQVRADIAKSGLDKGKEALAQRAAIFAETLPITDEAQYDRYNERALKLQGLKGIAGMLSRQESYEFEAILARMKAHSENILGKK